MLNGNMYGLILDGKVTIIEEGEERAAAAKCLRDGKGAIAVLHAKDGMWWLSPDRDHLYTYNAGEVTNNWTAIFPEGYEGSMPAEKFEAIKKAFKKAAYEYWESKVVTYKEIPIVSKGDKYYYNCMIGAITGECKVALTMSRVGKVQDSVRIRSVEHSSTILRIGGNACVERVSGNTTILRMADNSQLLRMDGGKIIHMNDNSYVEDVYGDAVIKKMENNSRIGNLHDHAKVLAMNDNAQIDKAMNNAVVGAMNGSSKILTAADRSCVVSMNGESKISLLTDYASIAAMEGNAAVEKANHESSIMIMKGDSIVDTVEDKADISEITDNAAAGGCGPFSRMIFSKHKEEEA